MARQLPARYGLAFGRVDVEAVPNMNARAAVKVQVGAPALKAYFRNAPPGKRALLYTGPPTLEAVLHWSKAIEVWDGSEQPPAGYEVGKKDDLPKPQQQKQQQRDPGARTSDKDEV